MEVVACWSTDWVPVQLLREHHLPPKPRTFVNVEHRRALLDVSDVVVVVVHEEHDQEELRGCGATNLDLLLSHTANDTLEGVEGRERTRELAVLRCGKVAPAVVAEQLAEVLAPFEN